MYLSRQMIDKVWCLSLMIIIVHNTVVCFTCWIFLLKILLYFTFGKSGWKKSNIESDHLSMTEKISQKIHIRDFRFSSVKSSDSCFFVSVFLFLSTLLLLLCLLKHFLSIRFIFTLTLPIDSFYLRTFKSFLFCGFD